MKDRSYYKFIGNVNMLIPRLRKVAVKYGALIAADSDNKRFFSETSWRPLSKTELLIEIHKKTPIMIRASGDLWEMLKEL